MINLKRLSFGNAIVIDSGTVIRGTIHRQTQASRPATYQPIETHRVRFEGLDWATIESVVAYAEQMHARRMEMETYEGLLYRGYLASEELEMQQLTPTADCPNDRGLWSLSFDFQVE